MNDRKVRAFLAGGSAVCGVIVGALVNLVTGRWSLTLACGLVVAVVCWTALEVWRSLRDPGTSAVVSVMQRGREVMGRMVGARGVGSGRTVDVRQTIGRIGEGGEVVGYDGDAGRDGDDAGA